MLIAIQIKAARAALRLSVNQLAELSGVSARTIKRMEADDGELVNTRANQLAVKAALEAVGIEFIGTPDDGPGIRLMRPKP